MIGAIFPLEPKDAGDIKNKSKKKIEFVPYAVPSMFYPLFWQFLDLDSSGFRCNFFDTPPGIVTKVHAYNILLSSDTPACSKHNSFSSHNGLCGCSMCSQLFKTYISGTGKNGRQLFGVDTYIPSSDFLQCELRDNAGILSDGLEWIQASTKSAARKILSQGGCRLSLLHNMMPSYDLSCGAPFEFSHGVIRGMLQLIDPNFVSLSEISTYVCKISSRFWKPHPIAGNLIPFQEISFQKPDLISGRK